MYGMIIIMALQKMGAHGSKEAIRVGCCGVVRGSIMAASAARPTAAGIRRTTGAASSGFVLFSLCGLGKPHPKSARKIGEK